eukprot:GAHX01002482.1.p1 GENE.GAHX01002482.1~~GAHX01002482.1.p1  ORF type:complete len:722 (-),score=161.38 GAHX01002482.1:57-2222(-)
MELRNLQKFVPPLLTVKTIIVFYILTTLLVKSQLPILTLDENSTNLSTFDFAYNISRLIEYDDDEPVIIHDNLKLFKIKTNIYSKEGIQRAFIIEESKELELTKRDCKIEQIGKTKSNSYFFIQGLQESEYLISCSDISLFSKAPIKFGISFTKHKEGSITVFIEYILKVNTYGEVFIQAITPLLFDGLLSDYKKSPVHFPQNEVSMTYFDSNISNLKETLSRYFLIHLFNLNNIQINNNYKEIIEKNQKIHQFFISFLELHNLFVYITLYTDKDTGKDVVLEVDFKEGILKELNTNIFKGLKTIYSINIAKIEFKLKRSTNKTFIEFYESYNSNTSTKQFEIDLNTSGKVRLIQFEKEIEPQSNDDLDMPLFFNKSSFDLKAFLKDKFFIVSNIDEDIFKDRNIYISIVKSVFYKIDYLSTKDYTDVLLKHEAYIFDDENYVKVVGTKLGDMLDDAEFEWENKNIFSDLIYSTEDLFMKTSEFATHVSESIANLMTFSDRLNKIDIFVNIQGSEGPLFDRSIKPMKYDQLVHSLYKRECFMRHSFLFLSTPFKANKIMLNKNELEDFLEINKKLTMEVEYNENNKIEIFDYSYENIATLIEEGFIIIDKDVSVKLEFNKEEFYNNRFIFDITLERKLNHDLKLSNETEKMKFLMNVARKCMLISKIFYLDETFAGKDLIFKYGESFTDLKDLEKNSMLTYVFLGIYLLGMLLIVGQITFT